MTRKQISTTVSQTTREQAEWLMENRGYTLRDVVTIGVLQLFTAEHGQEGVQFYVDVRLPHADDLETITETLSPEERGKALLSTANQEWQKALTIVADCAHCDGPITAADDRIHWNGEQVCESCEAIAIVASRSD